MVLNYINTVFINIILLPNLFELYHWKAHATQDIFAHNIAIKIYCNKEINLSYMFQWPTKVSSKTYIDLFFVNIPWFFVMSLPWPIDIHGPEISFYGNIVCKNVSYVTWVLDRLCVYTFVLAILSHGLKWLRVKISIVVSHNIVVGVLCRKF